MIPLLVSFKNILIYYYLIVRLIVALKHHNGHQWTWTRLLMGKDFFIFIFIYFCYLFFFFPFINNLISHGNSWPVSERFCTSLLAFLEIIINNITFFWITLVCLLLLLIFMFSIFYVCFFKVVSSQSSRYEMFLCNYIYIYIYILKQKSSSNLSSN